MSDTQGISDYPKPDPASDDENVAELRSLLLGQAELQLAEVHERLFDPHRQLKEISNVLPDAIAVRSRQDDELTTALSPTVSAALERSVRKNPQPIVDAIFPIHKKTGLFWLHFEAPNVAVQDTVMVSGMLTAIQNFVRDSFQTSRAIS